MAAGVGAAGSRNTYAPIISYIQAYQTTPGISSDLNDYLSSWVRNYRLLLAILILAIVLATPLMILLVYGLVQKLRTYRTDVVNEGMHRNPEL
jgi:hypothetical protein